MDKTVKINDLFHFDSIAAPQYSKQGDKILYVQTKLMEAKDKYFSEIRLYNLMTDEDQIVLEADSLNTQPLWATSGVGFYFISDRSGLKQIFFYNFVNQEIQKITNTSTGILDFTLHPNGHSILYLTKPAKVLSNKAYATKRVYYKFNGHGLIKDDDHLRQLWVQSLDNEKKKSLTTINLGFSSRKAFAISSDGYKIVFENKIVENDDFDFSEELCQLTLDENMDIQKRESVSKKFTTSGTFSDPCFSYDGRYMAFLGNQDAYKNANETSFFIYDFKKNKKITFLTTEDFQAGDSCVTDFHQNNTNPLVQWNEVEKCFIFVVSREGKVCLYSADPVEKIIKSVIEHNEHIQDFTIDPVKGDILVVVSRPDLPTGLFIDRINLKKRKKLKLTVYQKNEEYKFAKYQSFEFSNQDGGRIPCFFVLPPTFSMKNKIPLVLDIHGGPHAMHGFTFHHEVQAIAAQGMAVLLVNPRGSFGYGQEHANGVVGRYGQGDYQDLMIAVDKIVKQFTIIDPQKLFVTGGSYGGFMTNWITTKTNKFNRAVTQRSISNFVSMSGTSDIGYWFNTSEAGGYNILHPEKLWEESPLANINNVKTPTLILHSDQDLRCPIEQGEQWFVALKTLGIKTKFVRFFGESHELSRSGKPSNRIKRLTEIIDCFNQEDYFEK
jgi:dipeptidyl aminopeptidase/acylaminoacyl peptidase